MADKETPNSKRLKEEKRLEDFSELGLTFNEDRGAIKEPVGRKLARLFGKDDGGYGTSRSAGARDAAGQKLNDIASSSNLTDIEAADDPSVRQARREAAAEERREARGMKKGGTVKPEPKAKVKGWGIARGARKAKMY